MKKEWTNQDVKGHCKSWTLDSGLHVLVDWTIWTGQWTEIWTETWTWIWTEIWTDAGLMLPICQSQHLNCTPGLGQDIVGPCRDRVAVGVARSVSNLPNTQHACWCLSSSTFS